MALKCTVCSHPDAVAINEGLVLEKRSNRAMARQYSLHHDAIRRHREHIPKLLVKALDAEEAANADSLLAEVRDLQRRTLAILDAAEEDGADERKTALSAIREARENLRLLGNLAGELQEGIHINLTTHPEYLQVQALILTTLEPYPEAREALAEAIRDTRNGLREVS